MGAAADVRRRARNFLVPHTSTNDGLHLKSIDARGFALPVNSVVFGPVLKLG